MIPCDSGKLNIRITLTKRKSYRIHLKIPLRLED